MKAVSEIKIYFILILVVLICCTPMVAAWYFYHNKGSFKTTNKGEFVKPVVFLSSLKLEKPSGRPFKLKNAKWTLMYLNTGGCFKNCERTMNLLARIERAMGKERPRVQRLFVQLAGSNMPRQAQGLLQATVQTKHYQKLQKRIHQRKPSDSVFIVDPHGNIMMHYQVKAPPKDILRDLEKLLQVSQIG